MAFLTLLILARRLLPQPRETLPRIIVLRVARTAFLIMRRAAREWLFTAWSSSRREDVSPSVRLPPSLTWSQARANSVSDREGTGSPGHARPPSHRQ